MDESSNKAENQRPASAGFSEAMKSLYGGRRDLSPRSDQAIRAAVYAHFGKGRIRRRVGWRAVPWAAAIAIAGASAMWMNWPGRPPSGSTQVSKREPADLDGNGAVDILDAFALARSFDAAGKSRFNIDINGDGACDQADVDAIALRAVSVNRGTPS